TLSIITGANENMQRDQLDYRDTASVLCIGREGARMTIEPKDAKWNPKTCGEALYSTPYPVATAIIGGDVFLGDFTIEEVNRADKRELMQKITVETDPAITDQFEEIGRAHV